MKKQGKFLYKFIYKYEVDFWGYLISCSNGKRFFKKMFKIFCFKYKNQIQAIKSLYRKSYLDFNYSRIMEKKKKIKNLH